MIFIPVQSYPVPRRIRNVFGRTGVYFPRVLGEFHQHGLSNNRTETTWFTEPDDCDDRMQQKSQNVAHAPDRIRLQKLKNSVGLWNSPR